MEIVKTISEWKKRPKNSKGQCKPIKKGFKRIEAIVKTKFGLETRHIDVKK